MAKAAIKRLKEDRFWRWLCMEVYGKPAPKKPLKQYRKHKRFNWRKFHRFCDRTVARIMEIERSQGGTR